VRGPGPSDPGGVLVVVPTFNERENIAVLVPRLLALDGLRVLIVDDGSPDGTGAVADRLAAASGGRLTVMHRTGPRGLGRSYVDGMQAAVLTGVRRVCQMDADLSHDPIDLVRLIAAGASADLVIGSRYVPGGTLHNWPRRRVWLSAVANRYVRDENDRVERSGSEHSRHERCGHGDRAGRQLRLQDRKSVV